VHFAFLKLVLWMARICLLDVSTRIPMRVLCSRLQSALLKRTNDVLAMESDDKEAAVKELKKEMNMWTAKYRNGTLAGRPSFSNMYSAVNALAGHWNSFGPDAPVPKKRMARITKVQCSAM
jgi:Photosystem II Pbs27